MDTNLEIPGGITVTAAAEGVNRIEFKLGDEQNDARYEVWRRHGDTVDWYLHTTTDSTSFDDTDVKPGQYYEYKIRAVRGDSVSEFSQSAVVYGK